MEMMQAGFPVDPMQVIEKMELPATEKLRWVEYIQSQQQAAAEAEEKAMQAEMGMKSRELDIKEKDIMFDFIVDITKINQMLEKDEKRLATDFVKLDVEQQRNMAEFVAKMANVFAQIKKGEQDVARARNSATTEAKPKSPAKKA